MTIDFTQPVPGAATRPPSSRPVAAESPSAGSLPEGEDHVRPASDAESAPRVTAGDRARAAASLLAAPPLKLLMLAMNHLLRQQGWARQKLRMFRGRDVKLALEPSTALNRLAPPLLVRITDEGFLEPRPASTEDAPAVILWLRPSSDMLVTSISGKGVQAWSPYLRVEGDVMLAGVLAEMAQHLRWDAEDDLSRLVGDVAAHRLASLAGTVVGRLAGLRRRFEHSALEFLTAEDRQLVSGEAMVARREELAALLRRTDDLEARVRHRTP